MVSNVILPIPASIWISHRFRNGLWVDDDDIIQFSHFIVARKCGILIINLLTKIFCVERSVIVA